MKTLLFSIALLIFACNHVFSQRLISRMGENDFFITLDDESIYGTVHLIHEDQAIASLVENYIEFYKTRGMRGYRVQVFFGSGQTARSKAQLIKKKLGIRYPTQEVYLNYTSPFFKVLIGDFRTRNEALIFHKKLLEDYPNSWIIEDFINLPELRN